VASAVAAMGPVLETELSAMLRERRAAQRMQDRETQMERRREVVRRVQSEHWGSGTEGVRLAVGAMRAAQVGKAYKAMQKTASAEGEPLPSPCRGAVRMTPSCGVTCVVGHSLSYPGFPLLCNHLSYHAVAVTVVEKVRG
jgi:hypothetical protein